MSTILKEKHLQVFKQRLEDKVNELKELSNVVEQFLKDVSEGCTAAEKLISSNDSRKLKKSYQKTMQLLDQHYYNCTLLVATVEEFNENSDSSANNSCIQSVPDITTCDESEIDKLSNNVSHVRMDRINRSDVQEEDKSEAKVQGQSSQLLGFSKQLDNGHLFSKDSNSSYQTEHMNDVTQSLPLSCTHFTKLQHNNVELPSSTEQLSINLDSESRLDTQTKQKLWRDVQLSSATDKVASNCNSVSNRCGEKFSDAILSCSEEFLNFDNVLCSSPIKIKQIPHDKIVVDESKGEVQSSSNFKRSAPVVRDVPLLQPNESDTSLTEEIENKLNLNKPPSLLLHKAEVHNSSLSQKATRSQTVEALTCQNLVDFNKNYSQACVIDTTVGSYMAYDDQDYSPNVTFPYLDTNTFPNIPCLPENSVIPVPHYVSCVDSVPVPICDKVIQDTSLSVVHDILPQSSQQQSPQSVISGVVKTGLNPSQFGNEFCLSSSQFSDADSGESKKSNTITEIKSELPPLELSFQTNESKSSINKQNCTFHIENNKNVNKLEKISPNSKQAMSARVKLASKIKACLETSKQTFGSDVKKGIGLDSDPESTVTDPKTNSESSNVNNQLSDAGLSSSSEYDNKASSPEVQLASKSAFKTNFRNYGLGPKVEAFRPSVNQVIHAMVCEMNSPWFFYIHPYSTSLDELKANIHQYVTSCKPDQPLKMINNMVCLAKFNVDSSYYRARVRKFEGDKAIVKFIDYGNQEEVFISDLRPLTDKLAQLPAQAVFCALSGLAPADRGQSWTEDEINALRLNVQNQLLICKVVYCSDNLCFPTLVELSLMMWPDRGNQQWNIPRVNLNLSAVMIHQAMGRFVPISEQIVNLGSMLNDLLDKVSLESKEGERVPPMNLRNESLEEKHSVESGFVSLTSGKSPSPLLNVSKTGICSSEHAHGAMQEQKSDLKENVATTKLQANAESQKQNKHNKSVLIVTMKNEHTDVKKQNINATGTICDIKTKDDNCDISEKSQIYELEKIKPGSKGIQESLLPDIKTVSSCCKEQDVNIQFDVFMSHINSPGDFYVHKISIENRKNLDKLMQNINRTFFSYTKKQLEQLSHDFLPKVNDFCCAKFNDGNYYRGKVVKLINNLKSKQVKDEVVVFYIDFGDKETIPLNHLYPLPKEFMSIPPLALWCYLSDIKSPTDSQDESWPLISTVAFKDLCTESYNSYKVLSVTVAGDSLPESGSVKTEPLPVYLVNVNQNEEICVNLELFRLGFAKLMHTGCASDCPPNEDPMLPADWDPMEEDFHSIRNSYKIDVDDPSVATIGYKAQDDKRICRWFNTPGECWRGDICPYLHIKRTDVLTQDKEAVFVWNEDQSEILPEVSTLVVVMVSTIISPRHFYVLLPYGKTSLDFLQTQKDPALHREGEETLEDLQKSMNDFYQHGGSQNDILVYATGQAIAVKGQDNNWHRGKVVDSNPEDEKVMIFFVDFGNTIWVNERKIRKLDPQFLHLPLQAVECFLEDVELPKHKTLWSLASREHFRTLVDGKTLVAQILSKSWNGSLKVHLFDTAGNQDINIAQALIDAGYACETADEFPLTFSRNSSQESIVYLPG